MTFQLWDKEFLIPFPSFGNRNENIDSQLLRTGTGKKNSILDFGEQEWEAGIPGNGREREFPLTPVSSKVGGRKCMS